MPTHPFLKADKSKLGYYKPINRTTNPEQFRDPTEQPAADAAALERLNRLVQGVPSRPSTRQSTQERSDETADEMPQEPENPKDSDYVPDGGEQKATSGRGGQRLTRPIIPSGSGNTGGTSWLPPPGPGLGAPLPAAGLAASALLAAAAPVQGAPPPPPSAPAQTPQMRDALGIDEAPWQVGHPRAQPLTYAVRRDLQSGVDYFTIDRTVDFNSHDDVKRANAARHQARLRRNKALGLPPTKPNTHEAAYTQANNDWIVARFHSYAAAHNGARIPIDQLTREYNAHFGEQRKEKGLEGHIQRRPALRNVKNRYSK